MLKLNYLCTENVLQCAHAALSLCLIHSLISVPSLSTHLTQIKLCLLAYLKLELFEVHYY
jgi:hypothetical protein